MKPSRFKNLVWPLLYLSMLLIFLSPLYMYFSHDVAELNTLYPHALDDKSDPPQYKLRKKKPLHWVTTKEISSSGKWAIILSEDWGFYQHHGIDLNQLKEALSDMLEAKRFRGASTITQQMVKNVFLSNDRTLWRKLHEMILAQKVEKVLSKQKILEVYLNCIEFGPGIYGIKKASYHYFRKGPASLTPREGAFLAMLLPSPKRYYTSFKRKTLTPFARKRILAILGKMKMGKVISQDQYEFERNRSFNWER